jgi:hypothetical protein
MVIVWPLQICPATAVAVRVEVGTGGGVFVGPVAGVKVGTGVQLDWLIANV